MAKGPRPDYPGRAGPAPIDREADDPTMNRIAQTPRRPRWAPPAVVGLLAALLAALPACGPSEFLHEVYPATGVVTYQGKPVAKAMVSFHPVDPKTVAIPEDREGPQVASPTTQTDDSGAFSLSTYYADDGAPAGDYKVTVIWAAPVLAVATGVELSDDDLASGEFDPPSASQGREDPREASSFGNDRLKGKYADPGTTPLKATITAEGPNRFEFPLD